MDIEEKFDETIHEVNINDVYVNPDNARFYEDSNVNNDEISAINKIIKLSHENVISMCEDIAQNGLLPTNNFILSHKTDEPGKYIVEEGNRRITSLKLITIYKDQLDKFDLKASEKAKIKNLSSDIYTIKALISTNEEHTNKLLYQIHSPRAGAGQILWRPQAKDKHIMKTTQTISRELAFSLLLENLSTIELPLDINRTIKEGKWSSKLNRLLRKSDYTRLIGFEFDENNIIHFFYDLKTLEPVLVDFFKEVSTKKATEIAQSTVAQKNFIKNFVKKHKLNELEPLANSINFSPYTKEYSTIFEPINKKELKKLYQSFLSDNDTDDKPNNKRSENTSIKVKEKDISSTYSNNNSVNTTPQPKPATESKPATNINEKPKRINTKIPVFFENLKTTAVDASNPQNIPLLKITEEIVKFSKNGRKHPFEEYPIAATILFRAFVEQCLKYLIRNIDSQDYNKVFKYGDPALKKLVDTIQNNKKKYFYNNTQLTREFNALFGNDQLEDFLNLAAHHGRYDSESLKQKSQNFYNIASYILNTVHTNAES